MVKLLLEWGANPNVEDEDDETPLDHADDDDQIVRLLQLAGAKHVEKAESTYEQEHALRKAAFDGDLGEVRRLVKLGTDFHAMGREAAPFTRPRRWATSRSWSSCSKRGST